MKNYKMMVKDFYDGWEDGEVAGTFSVEDDATNEFIEKQVKQCSRKFFADTYGDDEMVGLLWEVIRDHNLEEAVNEKAYEYLFDGFYVYKLVEAE